MFARLGWQKFSFDKARLRWAQRAHQVARRVASDPEMVRLWLQCQGTWFVGVEALPTNIVGQIEDVPLDAVLGDFLQSYALAPMPPAQLSIIHEGYPKPRDGESEAGFRYRRDRDAAHVDGLHGLGSPKRRFLKEAHAFVLGVPLNQCDSAASPMVVWEGSHHIMREAFGRCFKAKSPKTWSEIDVTDIYISARKKVFDNCPRRVVHANLGEAYAIHPLTVHGVAPWQERAIAPKEGRMIAYFRPEFENWENWLS